MIPLSNEPIQIVVTEAVAEVLLLRRLVRQMFAATEEIEELAAEVQAGGQWNPEAFQTAARCHWDAVTLLRAIVSDDSAIEEEAA